ncbi:heme/hemin ABC transporter substrate-binding protein [Psychromonas sp. Urea-02u-13]|uniref:heme/hemin ABC transporter substrate-binding protein n=1 Tax=Psychromonas sp. Urea-02u-13 TaxID=2058326 RepID=UPI000C341A96|nr:ABC transporter substrate-binding protein [Psychromonas sp. Urea-02u-13]PKG39235.1 hemin ABC transporter substrate-binding protein [Psychromonas sp. Urea-02u-13]
MNKRVALFASMVMFFYSSVSQAESVPPRIISAGNAVTELIYALGAEQQLVAVDVTSHLPAESTLPKVGYHRQLSAEGLIALNPTHVVGSDEMGPDSTLDLLKQVGITVDVVNTEATIEGLLKRVDQLAEITQSQQNSGALKNTINKTVDALESNQPPLSTQKKVLFLMIHEGRPANVAGKETSANEIIRLAGAINPAAEKITSYKPLAMESLVEMQPDLILVSQRSMKKMGGIDAILAALPTLAATPAGKNRAIEVIDGAALLGGLGLKSLAEAKRLNSLLY